MILVVGSTGMVGSQICRLLAEKGQAVKALVRTSSDPAKVEALKGLGVQLVTGDLRDAASLKAACQGVDAVICTVSAMPFSYQPGVNDLQKVDLEGVKSLIDAARAAGVKHFIDTTFSKNINVDCPLVAAKRAVEAYLIASGLVYTILRPSCFMEVWLGPALGFDPANGKITVYGSGDLPLGWISLKDVAAFAVEALTNPAAHNAALELGGPVSLSYHQVIQIFE
jgi:NADH dehydrogenase